MRFWAISKDRGNLEKFYAVSSRYTKIITYIALLLTVLSAIAAGLITSIDWTTLMILSLVVGIITGWLDLRLFVFTADRKRQRVALLNTCNAFFRPVIATFLIVLIASNASWAMVGYLLSTCLILFIAERMYRHSVSQALLSPLTIEQPLSLSQDLGREIFSYSWPFFVWGMFGWIHLSCDRWALQAFHGPEVVGAFAVVSQLAVYPLVFGSGFLTTLFMPVAFQRAGQLNNSQSVNSAHKILVVMVILYILGVTILIMLFAMFNYPLVLLISNARFAEFSHLLPWLTAVWGLFYFGQVLFSFASLANKSRLYILPKVISCIVASTTTFYLSAKIGPVGVVWGLGFAGFVYVLWCGRIALKLAKPSLNALIGKEK